MVSQLGFFDLLSAPLLGLLILIANSAFFLLTQGRLSWGQRVLGYSALAIAATAISGSLAPLVALSSASLGFMLSYISNKRRWWVLLPAGLFAGLSLFLWLHNLSPNGDPLPIMLLIFAATFSILYLLPSELGGRSWAFLPALLMIILTVISNDPAGRTSSLILVISLSSLSLFFYGCFH
ncbi:MAG: hypothetical protein R2865_08940 [Deinococcales bacterium]